METNVEVAAFSEVVRALEDLHVAHGKNDHQ